MMITDNDDILGFIPARGGSKSIPSKNIALLGKRPLIAYVIHAARQSKSLNRIICSTDSNEIRDVCTKLEIPVMQRPKVLAQDDSPVIDVIVHMINLMKVKTGYVPHAIALLQATSPFLLPQHIDKCAQLLLDNQSAGSVQTITDFPHNYHAYNQRIVENGIVSFRFSKERATCYNKQRKPRFYIFGNLVITRTQALLDQQNVFAQPSLAVPIPEPYALDVDTPDDLYLAEWYIHNGKVRLQHME